MQSSPVAIGGVGGSGTRLIAGLLADLGYETGGDLNESRDNLWFTLLFKRRSLWPIEENSNILERLSETFTRIMMRVGQLREEELQLLAECVAEVTEEHPGAWREQRLRNILTAVSQPPVGSGDLWGWKEPNTHIVLPALRRAMPNLKYIHVMRHGVDMALSPNQNQLKLWGDCLLGRAIDPTSAADSLSYWCAVHRRLLSFDQENLLLLNFDRLCEEPTHGVGELLSFLGVQPTEELIQMLATSIQKPESVGRRSEIDSKQFNQADLAFVREMGF